MSHVNDTQNTCSPVLVEDSVAEPCSWAVRSVRWYQQAFAGRLSPCRFFPSCSEYSIEALHTHGTARGLWLTMRRLVRCRPFGPFGIDLVPSPHRRDVDPSHKKAS
jgi:putative membrane protein insertion efficiency factor